METKKTYEPIRIRFVQLTVQSVLSVSNPDHDGSWPSDWGEEE